MNYEEFKKILEERLKDYLPQGYKAKIREINKVNTTVDGVVFEGEKLKNGSPVIYVETLYKAYEETKDLDKILKELGNQFEGIIGQMPDIENFMNKEFVKQNVVFQLINTEQNKEKLGEVVHREFMDLSIIYRVIVKSNDEGVSGGMIHKDLAKALGFSEQELFECAKENTQRIFPLVTKDMGEMLGELEGGVDLQPIGMYVITNTSGINGAVGMLYNDKLSEVAEKLNSDLYIIPSSIHEVLVIKAEEGMINEVSKMISEVNNNNDVVPKEDVLSNQPYFYNKMFHSISTTKGDNIITETLINSPTKNKNKPIEKE